MCGLVDGCACEGGPYTRADASLSGPCRMLLSHGLTSSFQHKDDYHSPHYRGIHRGPGSLCSLPVGCEGWQLDWT